MAKIWNIILGLWPMIVAFGPGLILLLRYQIKKKEPSQMTLIIVICWTYYLLLQNMAGRSELNRDHKSTCEMLRKMIADPEEEWEGLPKECYKYTPEYRAEEAEYWASQE
ncbi:MAG: hypothetical protein KKB78_11725 [Alphaproteobacteria bacterium]|nr:hypothetical protein [Alphaproteobacteria bacterium]